jgi:hypothetical protein
MINFGQSVLKRLDQQLAALGIIQQIILQIGIATHHPNIAQHLIKHPRGTARLAFATQIGEQRPCIITQQAAHDFSIGERGVVVGNFT